MFQRASALRASSVILFIAISALACDMPFNLAAAPTATARPAIASQPTAAPTSRLASPTATAAPQPTTTSGTTSTGSTGLIDNVVLAQNATPLSHSPIGAGDTFPPKATTHVVVTVSQASSATSVKVVLTALDIGTAAAPNTKLGEYTVDAIGSQNLDFTFAPTSKGFPVGTYKADVYVDGKLDRTLDYSIKEGIAAVPTLAVKAVGSCPPPPQSTLKPPMIVKKITLADSVKSSDLEPVNPTNVFKPTAKVHAVVLLDNAPANTAVKAVWYALDTGGLEACNTHIAEYTIMSSGSKNLDFNYQPPSKFPLGNYRVEIYVDDTLGFNLDFSVK